MKEVIEFIKKLWENKRTRALAILILYFIFFIFVFIFINSGTKTVTISDPLDKLKNTNEYDLYFSGKDNFNVINDNILYNELSYTLEEKPIELIDYDISIYNPYNAYKLIKIGVLESTNYVNGNNTYLIKASDFEKTIYDKVIESDKNIRITINKDNIKEVLIDLSEYYGYSVKIDLRS